MSQLGFGQLRPDSDHQQSQISSLVPEWVESLGFSNFRVADFAGVDLLTAQINGDEDPDYRLRGNDTQVVPELRVVGPKRR